MTQIRLQDTGKYYVGASVVSGEEIAYGDSGVEGAVLTIKNTALSVGQTIFTSDPKQPFTYINGISTNAFDFGEAETTGIDQPKWTMTCYFSASSEDDMKTLGRLIFMCQTKGYKKLYTSTGNGFYDLIAYSKYGQRESAGESTKTVTFINVRIKSYSVTQSADNKGFRLALNMVETN